MYEEVEWIHLIRGHLPLGAELIYKVMGHKHYYLHRADIDGDGIEEIYAIYRLGYHYYCLAIKTNGHPTLFHYPYLYQNIATGYSVSRSQMEERAVYQYPAVIREVGRHRWGYINDKAHWVLPPNYEKAEDFQENRLAIIELMGKKGLINAKGYNIINPRYDEIRPFSEGRAVVIDREGFKVINQKGKEITEKAYSFIHDFQEGRALIAQTNEQGQNEYGYLNRRGKEVIPLSFQEATDFKDGKAVVKLKSGKYALIHLTGKILNIYSYPFVGSYGEGLLPFQKSKDGKLGYINEQGKMVIEPIFSSAQPFNEERAIVSLTSNEKNQYGLIDRNGHFIFKANYSDLLNLGENRFALGKEINQKLPCVRSIYALADGEGRILTGFLFYNAEKFEDGMASVSDEKYTYFIDKRGNRIGHLPIVKGRGTLQVDKTLIKGEVDDRLNYYTLKGELVWAQNKSIILSNQFKVIELKYKPNKDYLVYYPQIKGGSHEVEINKWLKDWAGVKSIPTTQEESTYTGDFEVSFFQKDLLVIEMSGYDYHFCAAHGMPTKKEAHINLQTGEIYKLKDLFKSGSAYVKVISNLIAAQIKDSELYPYLFPEQYHGIKDDQPFFIRENSLTIYFEPYEIAAFAAGFPAFTIPFAELEELIDKSGSFWRAFHT